MDCNDRMSCTATQKPLYKIVFVFLMLFGAWGIARAEGTASACTIELRGEDNTIVLFSFQPDKNIPNEAYCWYMYDKKLLVMGDSWKMKSITWHKP